MKKVIQKQTTLLQVQKQKQIFAAGATITEIHNGVSDTFTGIGCSKGTFLLKVKDNTKPYQVTQNIKHKHFINPSKKN